MLDRPTATAAIETALNRAPVVVLVGPRQCGKTTLARQFLSADSINYFDLESPASLGRLDEPLTALEPLRGLVVIDEVQLRPDIFPVLRVLADRDTAPVRFLILGSASGSLLRQTSESLAGRRERVPLGGLRLSEVCGQVGSEMEAQAMLWRRGGLPPSFLAEREQDSVAWRREFIQALLERDFPQWGVRAPATAMGRFWTMLAHYHGQTWNAAEPARALGAQPLAMRRYLDALTDAMMVRQLQPWFANIRKRQVKAPKIYIRDTGLLHQLLGIQGEKDLLTHPKIGASWEGFVIEQVLLAEPHEEAFFWATHQGAEIDLILRRDGALYGIECKFADAPRITPSIRNALRDVGLARVAILYPGSRRFALSDQVEVVPVSALASAEPVFAAD
ncbi:MAG: ATP-binding protein [Gammaproteobacteria bacterium]|nr:ATP-binding protein [Gammaproteobacteria bacterium]MXW46570.1 ATP-binding protein [Gammaproteobacteria bacterium]MYD00838.1 ATP-binding protein [Gammaproteobacteria bacterium]MYI23807.1 ATP-binding protein [Gammaproteobacteria bacterium]